MVKINNKNGYHPHSERKDFKNKTGVTFNTVVNKRQARSYVIRFNTILIRNIILYQD